MKSLALIILGAAGCYIGSKIGTGFVTAGLSVGGLIVLIWGIILVFKSAATFSGPLGIVRTQKKMYSLLRRSKPSLDKEELWFEVTRQRPGFKSPEVLAEMTIAAQRVSDGLKQPMNFQSIVFALVVIEYRQLNKDMPIPADSLFQHIQKIIPKDW